MPKAGNPNSWKKSIHEMESVSTTEVPDKGSLRYYRNYIVTTACSVGYSITAHKFVEVRNRQTLAIWKPSEFWKTLKGAPRRSKWPTKDKDWKKIVGL